jgi:hypothetical protein
LKQTDQSLSSTNPLADGAAHTFFEAKANADEPTRKRGGIDLLVGGGGLEAAGGDPQSYGRRHSDRRLTHGGATLRASRAGNSKELRRFGAGTGRPEPNRGF